MSQIIHMKMLFSTLSSFLGILKIKNWTAGPKTVIKTLLYKKE